MWVYIINNMKITPIQTNNSTWYDAVQIHDGQTLTGTAKTREEAIENCLDLIKIK